MKLLARQIKQGAGFPCAVAYQDLQPTLGNIYLTPADHHLTFSPPPVSLELNQEPKKNYLRPSADCCFEMRQRCLVNSGWRNSFRGR